MKIAMFGQKRVPSREGGIEVVVEEIASRMVAMGHDVTCYNRCGHHVSGKKYDLKKNYTQYKGIKLKTVPTLNIKGVAAISSSIFASIACAFGNYDVVHIHAEGPSLICWLPKLFGKKVIVTIHGLDYKRAKWGWFARKYLILGEYSAVKFADEIIVLSDGVKKYFKKKYGRSTNLIPNGVNKPDLLPLDNAAKQYSLNRDDYILYLGRIVPEKGIKYLIQAFKKVNTKKKLVIAGGTSDTECFVNELHKIAKSDKRIIFTGFVQGILLEELYSNAYIYTLPSDLEGMPLSLLEAMSYGNCCLVSDIPECKDVVMDKGICFNKGDVIDLKTKLQYLCDNPDTVKMYKKQARFYICNKYDWIKVTEKTLSVYKSYK